MKAFRDMLDKAGLKDLGFVGKKFTWKGQRHDGLVLERLDRAVANNLWLTLNPGTKFQHLHSYFLEAPSHYRETRRYHP